MVRPPQRTPRTSPSRNVAKMVSVGNTYFLKKGNILHNIAFMETIEFTANGLEISLYGRTGTMKFPKDSQVYHFFKNNQEYKRAY